MQFSLRTLLGMVILCAIGLWLTSWVSGGMLAIFVAPVLLASLAAGIVLGIAKLASAVMRISRGPVLSTERAEEKSSDSPKR